MILKQILVLFLCTLLLAGCGSGTESMDALLNARTRLEHGAGCRFRAEITADYGETLYEFTLACSADETGAMAFEVLAPESIEGITGTVSRESSNLRFDEEILAFDLLADGQLSPVSAPWVMLTALRSGYIRSSGREEERLRATVNDSYREDALTVELWLDTDGCPENAEIIWKGRRILTLQIEDFEFL